MKNMPMGRTIFLKILGWVTARKVIPEIAARIKEIKRVSNKAISFAMCAAPLHEKEEGAL
jgi:hypothetical protein